MELTGLIGSHPLGAMASFGLLRIVSSRDPGARLCFVERDDWVAELDSGFSNEAELVAFLVASADSGGAADALRAFGEDDVRVDPKGFREMLRTALADGSQGLDLAAFLIALAADGAEDNTKHLVKPTPFYMASGQQSFVDTMKRLRERVQDPATWTEGLFGPWRYATAEWGAGWDPGTERMHALRFKAPTKDKTACVAGAVWLGFQALPLFPTFSIAGRVNAAGWSWSEDRRLDRFRWPVPERSVSVDALAVLIASEDMADAGRRGGRLREGMAAVYESVRHEFGQGYAVFRPGRRVA